MLKTAEGVRFSPTEPLVYHDQDLFEANEVTLRILDLCQQPQDQEDLVARLGCEYQVAENELADDVSAIVSDLVQCGILVEV